MNDDQTQPAKPTIAELQAMLDAPEGRFAVQIKPDGSIHAVERPVIQPIEILSVSDEPTAPAAQRRSREDIETRIGAAISRVLDARGVSEPIEPLAVEIRLEVMRALIRAGVDV